MTAAQSFPAAWSPMRHCSALLGWVPAMSAHLFGQTREPYIYFENASADFGMIAVGN